jgi:hypothetical protein
MFAGPTQYLEVYLPSPTTVSFTVTTGTSTLHGGKQQGLSRRQMFKVRLLALIRTTFRLVLVYYAVLAGVVKARNDAAAVNNSGPHFLRSTLINPHVDFCLQAATLGFGGRLVDVLADTLEWWALGPLILLVVYLCLKRDYVGESIIVRLKSRRRDTQVGPLTS